MSLKYIQLLVLLLCVTRFGFAKDDDELELGPDDESEDLEADEALLREFEEKSSVRNCNSIRIIQEMNSKNFMHFRLLI